MVTQLERIENELRIAGYNLQDKDEINSDDDYAQSVGKAAYDVCKLFCEQDHSGMSAGFTIGLITKLLKGDNLTPLTNDPSEWEQHPKEMDPQQTWQSKRKFSCFSDDNLKTYYDIDEEENREWELDDNGKRTGWSSVKPRDQLIYHELKSREELEKQKN